MKPAALAAGTVGAVAIGIGACVFRASHRPSSPQQPHVKQPHPNPRRHPAAPSSDFDSRVAARAIMRLSSAELAELRSAFIAAVASSASSSSPDLFLDPQRDDEPELDRERFIAFLAGLAEEDTQSRNGRSRDPSTNTTSRMRAIGAIRALTAGEDVSEETSGFIFELFDTDRNGAVSLREFLCGLSILCRGSKSDRLKFLFYMYDEDNSGSLSSNELLRVIRIMRSAKQLLDRAGHVVKPGVSTVLDGDADFMDEEWDDNALVENILDCADLDRDGSVAFPEFEAWANTNEIVGEWSEWIGNICGDALAGLRDTKERELRLLELARMGFVPDDGMSYSGDIDLANDASWTSTMSSSEVSSATVQPAPKVDREEKAMSISLPSICRSTSRNREDVGPFLIDFKAIQMQEEIGAGAFASVHQGEWLQLPVAVKTLHDNGDKDQKIYLRDGLIREVALLTALRHPNIILYMGLCLDLEHPLCIVTELFPGGSLTSFLDKQGPPPLPIALRIALDIARGMIYLHSSSPKVLHRDLKSQNILITGGEAAGSNHRVAICDFGLSQLGEESQHSGRRQGATSGDPSGTPYTMAPEVISGGPHCSRSDIYSFAIVLWELFTGSCNPFGIMSSMQVMYTVVEGGRPPLEPLEKNETPLSIIQLIERCWHEEVEERPDFVQVAKLLSDIANGTLTS